MTTRQNLQVRPWRQRTEEAHTDPEEKPMTDRDDVRATALDYFEGWYDGDAERMARALHPELVKRWAGDTEGVHLGKTLDKSAMVTRTAEGGGSANRPEERIDVDVLDVYRDIATVVVRSPEYREYLHLVRTPQGWQIVNAFYRMTEGVTR
jgi:hypothetical protein